MRFTFAETLVDAAEATGVGVTVSLPADAMPRYQAIISNTATVKVQGSVDGTNWFDLRTSTANDAFTSESWPYIRGNVTAYTSGTVTLLVAA